MDRAIWYLRRGVSGDALAWRFGESSMDDLTDEHFQILAGWQPELKDRDIESEKTILTKYFPAQKDLDNDNIPPAPYRLEDVATDPWLLSLESMWERSIGMMESIADLEVLWQSRINSSEGTPSYELNQIVVKREQELGGIFE